MALFTIHPELASLGRFGRLTEGYLRGAIRRLKAQAAPRRPDLMVVSVAGRVGAFDPERTLAL